MMCPDHRAVDHVSDGIARYHLGQRLQKSVENAHLDPAPISPEGAVPFAVFIRQQPPLRARSRHPHHTFEIAPIVASGSAAAVMFRGAAESRSAPIPRPRPQSARPKLPPKDSLEATPESQVKLCPRGLVELVECIIAADELSGSTAMYQLSAEIVRRAVRQLNF